MIAWAAFFIVLAVFAVLTAGACIRFDHDRQRDMDLKEAERGLE